MTATAATIKYLKACQARRAAIAEFRQAGGRTHETVSYTDSPTWLVNMAINRRAGWPDDDTMSRGSAMPVNGQYPKRARGDNFMLLWRLAHTINGTRIIIRERDVPKCYQARLANRIRAGEEY